MPHAIARAQSSSLRGNDDELSRKNTQLQKQVDILEVRLREQESLINAQTRRSQSSARGGPSDHWGLAVHHAGSAISNFVSTFCALLCSSLWCLCDEYRRHRDRRDSEKLEDDDASKDGSEEHGTTDDAVRRARKNKLIPSWDTHADKLQRDAAAKAQAGMPGSMSSRSAALLTEREKVTAPKEVHLENHEYVLEEEWGHVPTNGVINPKARWKETWDLGVLAFILYSSVVVPFRICFSAEAEGNMWYFEVGISFFFITDVLFK